MSVRLADPADAGNLASVAAATFALACPPGTDTAEIAAFISSTLSVEHFENYLSDPERTVLLAQNEHDVAVGYSMLVRGEPRVKSIADALSCEPTVELSKMYVLEGSHGSGVAGSLMTAVLDLARARECAGVWLGVNQLNIRAQKFYGKHGFSVVGTKTFVVGTEVHNDFVMERAL